MARRKSTDSIAPFPSGINRDSFGHYLSGLVDGEGCFYLGHYATKKIAYHPVARFQMKLRCDDHAILALVRSYWRCGNITIQPGGKSGGCNRWPQSYYQVTNAADLALIVMPHFVTFPLYAKKVNDYGIWAKAVRLYYEVSLRRIVARGGKYDGTHPRWSEADKASFKELASLLRRQRSFGAK